MSYCLNPNCNNPSNLPSQTVCQACGASLLLRDRYRATRILGRGGFATTFLATDEGLPGTPSCVIKQLRPVLKADHILEMSRELFQREASTLGKIGNHPQLPRLLDFFELEEDFYLIQEYVSGATLQQEVRRSGPFNEAMAKVVLKEVLPMLDYLHQQQVIHRDIKPANIIRRTIDKKLVLIDFGAVKDQVSQTIVDSGSEEYTSFAVGTPGFAPPEQMAMRPVYASDIYSLGVTCIYLLTGKSPKDLNYNQSTGELNWRKYVHISQAFNTVLAKMLEVSLRDRYQQAKEVLQALEEIQVMSPSADAGYSGGYRARASTADSSLQSGHLRAVPPRRGAVSSPGPSRGDVSARRMVGRTSTRRSLPGSTTGSSARKAQRTTPAKLSAQALQQAYDRGQRDFSSYDLSHLSLPRFQLADAVFHETQLQKSDLRGADLNHANLGRARLVSTNLRNAKLQEAYLSYADLESADLRGADLTHAYLSNANLRGANLCGANLSGATVSQSQLSLAQVNWMTILPNGKRGKGLW